MKEHIKALEELERLKKGEQHIITEVAMDLSELGVDNVSARKIIPDKEK